MIAKSSFFLLAEQVAATPTNERRMINTKTAYLDNASTTRVDPAIAVTCLPYLTKFYGNPGSIHTLGKEAFDAISKAREEIATSLQTIPDNIVFTGSGSESNTLAILGLAGYLRSKGRTHVITTPYEHKSVLKAMDALKQYGFKITYCELKDGIVDLEKFNNALRDDTGLVSIMHVNNETGSVNPIKKIGKICQSRGVIFHSDCVQSAGAIHLNPRSMCCDLMSVSGHKIHAPKGVGFLYTRFKEFMSPVICGGGQESGLRPGTENVFGIVALGKAFKLVNDSLKSSATIPQYAIACQYTMERLSKIDGFHVTVPYDRTHCGKVLSIRFDGIDAETLSMMLNENNVYVSTGSACNTGSADPSYVLLACGLTPDEARQTVRLSFSNSTTNEEFEYGVETIRKCVEKLRLLNAINPTLNLGGEDRE